MRFFAAQGNPPFSHWPINSVTKERHLFFTTLSLILKPLTPNHLRRAPLLPHICLLD
ncbi:hypothetical protein SBA4_1280054 [Candidatus Sulfopaludibacter sp. SbA4]|nr:hypothetical protein SBA4_1280054 [Candidatus Sulfopaludibacter sp. SbA4]